MKKKWTVIALFISMLLIASCSAAERGAELKATPELGERVEISPGFISPKGDVGAGDTAVESLSVPEARTSKAGVAAKDRLVIKTKTVQMEVSDVVVVKTKIEETVKHYKGYVSNLYTSSDEPPPPRPLAEKEQKKDKITRATIEVKIPAGDLDRFVKEIKKLGKLESDQEQAQDITKEYVDLNARLKNLQAAEARLLEMYRAAKNVEEMLKIEAQLTTVRGEIESLQGQIDYYKEAVAMATITIDIHEPTEIKLPEWSKKFSEALNEAINNFFNVITGLIVFAGGCLGLFFPVAFMAFIVYLILVIILRRRKK